MQAIRVFLFYAGLFFFTIFFGSMATVMGVLFRRTDLAHLCGRMWGNAHLWAAGVEARVEGLENIEPEHPYIYASNHQGWFDIFAILGRLPVQFRWLAKEELFRIPFLGLAMHSIGYIPIDRGDRRKAFMSIRRASEQVRTGTSIVIFPEGTRSRDGMLQDFKKGGFILAMQSKQPIVPVTITGSYRIMPRHGWTPAPGVIRITVGKPIPTAGLTNKDRGALISEVRHSIMAHLPQSEGGLLPDRAVPPLEAIPKRLHKETVRI